MRRRHFLERGGAVFDLKVEPFLLSIACFYHVPWVATMGPGTGRGPQHAIHAKHDGVPAANVLFSNVLSTVGSSAGPDGADGYPSRPAAWRCDNAGSSPASVSASASSTDGSTTDGTTAAPGGKTSPASRPCS